MIRAGLLVLAVMTGAAAPWLRPNGRFQDAHTTASLRGIHSLGAGVAWASGTGGTVLLTVDGGKEWQHCAVPEGAEKLDFRGVQGFDAKTAIVMSSGKGDLSRLYKTVDACRTWKLVFTNPDAEGFWDAIKLTGDEEGPGRPTRRMGTVIGDPVRGHFFEAYTYDYGEHWQIPSGEGPVPEAEDGEALFAASNSSISTNGDERHHFRHWWQGRQQEQNSFRICKSRPSRLLEICRW